MRKVSSDQMPLFAPEKACSHCAGLGTLEATDIFCGAGGSSLGLELCRCPYCGRSLFKVIQALNHWDLAVLAHNKNFPHADHDVHDVEVIAATRFKRTPVLWASPECTHHAYCRGPKQLTQDAFRSRATFSDIVRFTEHHKYDAVIVENVVEARLWCDEAGHGEKCNCGGTFNRWMDAILDLGYEGKIVYFNSQFALPTPQSRDRMYVVFWRKGAKKPMLNFRPACWCSGCELVVRGVQAWKKPSKGSLRDRPGLFEWGRYGQQYIYICPICGEPAAPAVTGSKTIIDWSLPATRIGDRDKPLAPNTRKRIRVGLEYLEKVQPITVQVGGNLFERQGYARVWSVEDPLRTVLGTSHMALVDTEGMTLRVGGQQPAPRSTGDAMTTVTAHDRQRAVVVPVGGQVGQARNPASTDEPVKALTGQNHRGLVTPAGGQPAAAKHTEEPSHTIIGNDRLAAVEVPEDHMLVQATHAGPRRARRTDEPTPTIAGHGELGIVSMRNHGQTTKGEEPAQTVVGGGNHHGLLVYNGVPGFVRSLEDAAGTVTGRDKQSLLVPYNRTGVARTLSEPSGTLTTRDREALVVTEDDIDACTFRMLQWHELLKAQVMHLLPDGSPYELSARHRNARGKYTELSNEQRVKMIGNAVSSPVAAMLGWSVAEALAGDSWALGGDITFPIIGQAA